jgi:hypothetical protein
MKNLIRALSTLALAALLTACGGSDSGFAGDKYIGTWAMCRQTGTAQWEKETLTITAGTTPDTLAFTSSTAAYFNDQCSGAFGTPQLESGTISNFDGTKTIGSETVDRVFIGNGGLGEKQVLVVRATNPLTLVTGRSATDGGTLDADGYPATLDTDVFVRQ